MKPTLPSHSLPGLRASIALTALLLVAPVASAAPAPAPPPAPAAAPQSDWPQGAPVAAAVLVHRGERCRLALADLVHGTYEDLGPADEDVNPVWSPDGTQLAYVAGSTLTILRPGKGPAIRVRGGLPVGKRPEKGFAFSPDGQRLAVATMQRVEVYRLGETAVRVASAPSRLIPSHLSWAQDGQHLAACRWNGDQGVGSHESLALYTVEGTTLRARVLLASISGCEILGLRHGLWLARRIPREAPEEVVAVSAEGKSSRLRSIPSDYVPSAYLAAPDAIAGTEGVDDPGDATYLSLFSLSDKSRRPWMRKFREILHFTANQDGSYVLLTVPFPGDSQQPGGKILLSATDGSFSRQVLPAPGSKSKNPAFSNPLPRPLLRTSP